MFYPTIILILTLFFLLYKHVTRNFNYWKDRGIPYVSPIPFFGTSLSVITQREAIGDFLYRIYKSTKEPYLGFFGFDRPFLLIREPEIVKAIFVKDFDNFPDRSVITGSSDEVGKNILFVVDNPDWKLLRVSVAPAFTTGKLRQMLVLMNQVGDEMIDLLKSKKVHSSEFISSYATDVISTCAFGIQPHSLRDGTSEIKRTVESIFAANFNRSLQRSSCFFMPLLVKWLDFTFMDVKATQYLTKMFWDIMGEREKSQKQRGDLIDILIKTRNKQKGEEEAKITDTQIMAQAAQYLAAGIETIDITIFMTLYTLITRPDIQTRLRAEINEHAKQKEISYETLHEITYLEMVVREVLRMYPPLPYLDRRCVKEYTLPGTDVKIDAGVPVYLSLYGFQYDPEYFPEPEKFIPERFADKDSLSAVTYLNMPFGVGPRNCPGEKFGMITVKLMLIKLLQNFEVLSTSKTPSPMTFKTRGIVIQPTDDLHMILKPLENSLA